MKKIIVTGPECSGKSTLARQLSYAMNGVYVPELARSLLLLTGNRYGFADLAIMGEQQRALELAVTGLDKKWIIHDTSMLVLKIWSLYRFNAVDSFIEASFAQSDAHLWLLCTPLEDWQPDGLRVNQYERDHLFNLYSEELQKAGKRFLIVPASPLDERIKWVLDHTSDI